MSGRGGCSWLFSSTTYLGPAPWVLPLFLFLSQALVLLSLKLCLLLLFSLFTLLCNCQQPMMKSSHVPMYDNRCVPYQWHHSHVPVPSGVHARARAGGGIPLPDGLRTLLVFLAQGGLWTLQSVPGEFTLSITYFLYTRVKEVYRY